MGGACGVSKYVMCGHWCQSANWRNLAAAAGVHASSGSAAQHGTSPEGGGATNHARLSLTSQRLRKGGEARPRLGRHGVLPAPLWLAMPVAECAEASRASEGTSRGMPSA